MLQCYSKMVLYIATYAGADLDHSSQPLISLCM